MSHIVSIKTEIRDQTALAAACRRLALAPPVEGTFKLFTATASGLGVQLPGWNYPVVIDTASGSMQYDNYQGRWGDSGQLHLLLQAYAVEMARLEARRKGHTVTEQQLSDGSIKLTIHVGA